MESTPRLYDTLVHVLSQHQNWVDRRHLKTLAWMMVGLMQAGKISLTAWAPYVHSRAVYAQSLVRRFARWLAESPDRRACPLWSPDPASPGRVGHKRAVSGARYLNLVEDLCLVRISLVYRGGASPIVWKVLEHPQQECRL